MDTPRMCCMGPKPTANTAIIVVPGNPGVAAFYRTFVAGLSSQFGHKIPVYAVGLAGFLKDKHEKNKLCDLEEQARLSFNNLPLLTRCRSLIKSYLSKILFGRTTIRIWCWFPIALDLGSACRLSIGVLTCLFAAAFKSILACLISVRIAQNRFAYVDCVVSSSSPSLDMLRVGAQTSQLAMLPGFARCE